MSNVSSTEHKGAEGGILNGHGPLSSPLSLFLVQAVIIISLSRFLHIFLRKLRQPRVIAELVGGVCLGPSVLGNIPGFTRTLFPESSLGFLNLIANVGLVFYLFLVGLELEPQAFFHNIKRSAIISAAGIIVPFGVGVGCSYGLFVYLLKPNDHNIPFSSFLLFTGVALSITAFPVLCRILTEKKMLHTPVGLMSVSAAALNDATAWALLALVISILNAGDNMTALYVFLLALGYTLILLLGLRRLFAWFFDRYLAKSSNPISQFFIAVIFCCLFLSAWITELIGIHAIFGAFLFGLVVPRGNNIPIRLTEKIEDVIIIGFLPLFFAASGLRTNIGLLDDGMTWLWLFIVIAVACLGKFIGTAVSAKFCGLTWREANSIGVLMSTKGLVELIVLNIGYDAHVINDRIFLIMVVMALVTTFMTTPIISVIYPPKYFSGAGVQSAPGKSMDQSQAALSGKLSKMSTTQLLPADTMEPIKMLLCVDDLEPVPFIARLLWLFKPEKNNDDDLIISALKIIEPTERTSSFMVASQIDAIVKNDPALNMINLFGNLIGVQTSAFVSMTSVDDVGEEVNNVSMRENCTLLMLPWNDSIVHGSILSSSPQEMLRNIINCSEIPTAIFVPKPAHCTFSPPQVLSKIVVIFFGGSDDREAVRIGLRMFRHGHGVHVTILCIKVNIRPASPHSGVSYISGTQSETTVEADRYNGNKPASIIVNPTMHADEETIETVRNLTQTHLNRGLTLETVYVDSPLPDAFKECLSRRCDLLILGRRPTIERERYHGPSLPPIDSSSDVLRMKIDSEAPRKRSVGLGGSMRRKFSRPLSPKLSRLSMRRSTSHQETAQMASSPAMGQRHSSVTWRISLLTDILGCLGEIVYDSNMQTSILIVTRNVCHF